MCAELSQAGVSRTRGRKGKASSDVSEHKGDNATITACISRTLYVVYVFTQAHSARSVTISISAWKVLQVCTNPQLTFGSNTEECDHRISGSEIIMQQTCSL